MSRRVHGYAAIGLINPKDPFNVGAALRAVGCFEPAGAHSVIYTGQRFAPPSSDVDRVYRSRPLIYVGPKPEDIWSYDAFGITPVCLEMYGKESLLEFEHPERALYIFGPEDGNVPPSIAAKCRHVLRIPTEGCLNLAQTVTTVLYDRLLKMERNER